MMRGHLALALVGAVIWALPHVLSRHLTDLLVFAIYTIAGVGVGLLLGHCGINLELTAFGIGACSAPTSQSSWAGRASAASSWAL